MEKYSRAKRVLITSTPKKGARSKLAVKEPFLSL